jgi:hypothetical protein
MVYPTTTNKSLEKPDHGTAVDVWDVPLNSDFNIIDKSFGGVVIFNATAGSQTLTSGVSAAYSYIPLIIQVEGSISANVVYTIPSGVGGQWVVRNITTDGTGGPWTVSFVNAYSGLGVVIPRGYSSIINSDGAAVNFSESRVPAAAGSDRQIQFNSGGYLGASSAFTYDSSGNLNVGGSVGIGVTPSSGYKINTYGNSPGIGIQTNQSDGGTGGGWIDFLTTGGTVQANIYWNQAGGYMTFGTAASGSSHSESMRITSSGNIGIGNTPTQKLEVSGTIYSNSGGFKFPDGSTQTTAATGYTPPTSFSAVGTYAFMFYNGGAVSSGGTVTSNGSNLFPCDTDTVNVSSVAAGQVWQCMGYNGGSGATLWLRIS